MPVVSPLRNVPFGKDCNRDLESTERTATMMEVCECVLGGCIIGIELPECNACINYDIAVKYVVHLSTI